MRKIPIDEDQLRQMYADDVKIADIAKHFGCEKSTLERRAAQLGLRKARTGPKNGPLHVGRWKGGRTHRKGYAYLYKPDHPCAINGRYVAEHRYVMEQIIGRLLLPGEVVHHKDGNRLNNDPANLELFASNAEHLRHELSGKTPKWTQEGWAAMCRPRGSRRKSKSSDPQDTQSSDHPASQSGSILPQAS